MDFDPSAPPFELSRRRTWTEGSFRHPIVDMENISRPRSSANVAICLETFKKNKNQLIHFFAAASKAFLENPTSSDLYIKALRSSLSWDVPTELSLEVFYKLKLQEHELDFSRAAAVLNSDASLLLCNVFNANAYKTSLMSETVFEEVIKAAVGARWEDPYHLNVEIFYTLNRLKRSIIPRREHQVSWAAKALEVSENTMIFLYVNADETLKKSIDLTDEIVFNYFWPSNEENSLQGYNRLPLMYSKITRSGGELVSRLTESALYKLLDRQLGMERRLLSARLALSEIRETHGKCLLNHELPQTIIIVIRGALRAVRLNRVNKFLDKTIWEYIDTDHDGVVTIGDLYTRVLRFNPWKALFYFIMQCDEELNSMKRPLPRPSSRFLLHH